jgi:hypothetical protein
MQCQKSLLQRGASMYEKKKNSRHSWTCNLCQVTLRRFEIDRKFPSGNLFAGYGGVRGGGWQGSKFVSCYLRDAELNENKKENEKKKTSRNAFLREMLCLRPFIHFEFTVPSDRQFLDSAFDIGPLKSRWELEKFKNCWNKSFRTSKIWHFCISNFRTC